MVFAWALFQLPIIININPEKRRVHSNSAKNSDGVLTGTSSNAPRSSKSSSPLTMMSALPSALASKKMLSFGSRQIVIRRFGTTASPRKRTSPTTVSISDPGRLAARSAQCCSGSRPVGNYRRSIRLSLYAGGHPGAGGGMACPFPGSRPG
jgi:hypothetical protein